KGKYSSSDVCRIRGLISTLTKACDLIRTLSQDEVNTDVERREVQDHLVVLFDRLVRMGIYTIPPLEIKALVEWSKSTATQEIQLLRDYLEKRKLDMISQERERSRKLFMDPKKRKMW